jgi:hypothetical protein
VGDKSFAALVVLLSMQKYTSKSERIQAFQKEFPKESTVIQQIRDRNLTYCGYPKLENICRAIKDIQVNNVPGIYIEAGCALGGSAILMASMKAASTSFYVFDVFGLIPSPSERDGEDAHARYEEIRAGNSSGLGGNQYYGYIADLRSVVTRNIESFGLNLTADNIYLVQGLFQETLEIREPVALAHIDCDWYDSVKTCISRLRPHMSEGSMIIFDDYSSFSGCRRAVDELLQDDTRFTIIRLERSATLMFNPH